MESLKNFPALNLPNYNLKIHEGEGKIKVFDEVRRKQVLLNPEEWVRQHFIHYLAKEKKFPIQLMAVEKKVKVNELSQRFDLLVYNRKGKPYLVAEFKAPSVKITQDVFDQAVRYNSRLKVPFILVSNGLDHFICKMDYDNNSVVYLKEIPEFYG